MVIVQFASIVSIKINSNNNNQSSSQSNSQSSSLTPIDILCISSPNSTVSPHEPIHGGVACCKRVIEGDFDNYSEDYSEYGNSDNDNDYDNYNNNNTNNSNSRINCLSKNLFIKIYKIIYDPYFESMEFHTSFWYLGITYGITYGIRSMEFVVWNSLYIN